MFIIFNPESLLAVTWPKVRTKRGSKMDTKRCSAGIAIIVGKLGTD